MISIQEVEHYLNGLHTNSGGIGKDVTVERMWPLLKKVGNPQEKLGVIHVAGTSGKTSTAYFIAAMLRQSGKKIGLTVSPHISTITERLQINGAPIEESEFCELFTRFSDKMGENPDATYFEYLIVFVFWAFVELGVDYAVVETGLGGLHDGTNVCRRGDKVCIITDIGFDHQNILGDTIKEIATQKAGIIHERNQVFMYRQSEEITSVFIDTCMQKNASLNLQEQNPDDKEEVLPEYQSRNWNLAKQVAEFIMKRDKLPALSKFQLAQTKVQVPGRLQEVRLSSGRLVVIDGAHNEQKMKALVKSFIHKYGDKKVPVVLAIKQGKDYEAVIETLAPLMSIALCCGYNIRQDVLVHSAEPEEIARIVESHHIAALIFSTINEAVLHVLERDEPITLVTGSLYSIGDVLRLL